MGNVKRVWNSGRTPVVDVGVVDGTVDPMNDVVVPLPSSPIVRDLKTDRAVTRGSARGDTSFSDSVVPSLAFNAIL